MQRRAARLSPTTTTTSSEKESKEGERRIGWTGTALKKNNDDDLGLVGWRISRKPTVRPRPLVGSRRAGFPGDFQLGY
jgi:hypothetical protein